MSAKIPLAIVGCGGMGHRHMYGLAELHDSGLPPLELVGACDPNLDRVVRTRAERLGTPPAVAKMSCLHGRRAGRRYMRTGAPPASPSMLWSAAGTSCVKAIGLTTRACKLMREASERTGCILSVAENYRRDPINRLAKALLDAGAIGYRTYDAQCHRRRRSC